MRAYLIKWRGLQPEEADDCLQGFVTEKVIEKGVLTLADRRRGRFRSFLLVILNNYLSTFLKRARRVSTLHRQIPSEPDDLHRDDPARGFDTEWAQTTVQVALTRMAMECEASGRMDIWRIFQERILKPANEGREPTSYETLVRELKLKHPIAAANLLMTAKRMYIRMLRLVIGEFAMDANDIDSELAELRTALACIAHNATNGRVDASST